MDYKFKVGDRVRVVADMFATAHEESKKGSIGTIVERDVVVHNWYRLDIGYEYMEHWLEIAYVQDSKLARNLYKNQIDKIEDGKIWLK